MTDKELRKLSREDLLEMLVAQSREVERLKKERGILISQLRYYKVEFEKAGSLDAILGRLGYPAPEDHGSGQISALDELLLLFENEQSTSEIFENEDTAGAEENKNSRSSRGRQSGVQDRLKEAIDWTKIQFSGKK